MQTSSKKTKNDSKKISFSQSERKIKSATPTSAALFVYSEIITSPLALEQYRSYLRGGYIFDRRGEFWSLLVH